MTYIPGPDFPTGGIIMGTQGIREAYRTGRGRIVVRARTEIEQMQRQPFAHRRDGNPLSGQQGAIGRENRRACA